MKRQPPFFPSSYYVFRILFCAFFRFFFFVRAFIIKLLVNQNHHHQRHIKLCICDRIENICFAFNLLQLSDNRLLSLIFCYIAIAIAIVAGVSPSSVFIFHVLSSRNTRIVYDVPVWILLCFVLSSSTEQYFLRFNIIIHYINSQFAIHDSRFTIAKWEMPNKTTKCERNRAVWPFLECVSQFLRRIGMINCNLHLAQNP